MTGPVAQALTLWRLDGAPVSLVAERENKVYRVNAPGGPLALRLHRPGYRTAAELVSELDWMAALADRGNPVAAPVPARDGALMHEVAGVQCDMLGWLDGTPLAQLPVGGAERAALFARIGAGMGRLHSACDDWQPGPGFTRWAWDADGLLGEAPLWGRFWENPSLPPEDRALMERFRDRAGAELARIGDRLDYGLIHADLVGDNVLVDGETLHLIDFDDGGYGYRLFDLATALIKTVEDPDHAALRAALCEGYLPEREIDIAPLDLFLALRAVTYLGWIVPRMGEPGAEARNARFLRTSRLLVTAWMES
jgi:Ser/Thr protein kinase RdoA (MazF antagonist)